MKYCNFCGAVSRINYPFGRKAGGRVAYIRKHSNICRYSPEYRR